MRARVKTCNSDTVTPEQKRSSLPCYEHADRWGGGDPNLHIVSHPMDCGDIDNTQNTEFTPGPSLDPPAANDHQN